MHPDVPRWAREILEREVADVQFSEFHVLKDAAFQKLAVGYTATEMFIVQRVPAGGELYRVAHAEAPHAPPAERARLEGADAAAAACTACGTRFRYWRENGSDGSVYCFNCGTPAAPPREDDEGVPARAAGA